MTPRLIGIELARTMALQLLRRFGKALGEPICIEQLAKDLEVELVDLALDGARAQLVVINGQAYIQLSTQLIDPADRRWAIAHELGHFVLEHPAPPAAELCVPRPPGRLIDSFAGYERDIEAEADMFAATVLIAPELVNALRDTRPMTLGVVDQLARTSRAPLTAAAVRITEQTFRICTAVLSQRGVIRWFAPSLRFLERFGRPRALAIGAHVDPLTMAGWSWEERAQGAGNSISDAPRIIPAARWVGRRAGATWRDGSIDAELLEHSLPIDDRGHVLTMLWAPQDLPSAGRLLFGVPETEIARARSREQACATPASKAIGLPRVYEMTLVAREPRVMMRERGPAISLPARRRQPGSLRYAVRRAAASRTRVSFGGIAVQGAPGGGEPCAQCGDLRAGASPGDYGRVCAGIACAGRGAR